MGEITMTKKRGTIIGAIALTLVLGCGLIVGNAFIASWVMGAENKPSPITQNELFTVTPNESFTVTPNEPVSENQAEPISTSSISSQQDTITSETFSANRVSTGIVTNESGQTVIVEYYFDESDRTVKADVTVENPDDEVMQFAHEGITAEQFIERVIGQEEYNSWASQVGAPTRADRRAEADINSRYIDGNPDESEISEEMAIANAIQLLMKKYALRQETVDRFTVTAKYYTKNPDVAVPAWWVLLEPTNTNDYSEIGSYWAFIDSSTGEEVGLYSAVDGKG